jgi:hypothetical protein
MPTRNSFRRNSSVCPKCGHANRADAHICVECYTPLREERGADRSSLRRSASRRASSRADELRAIAQGNQTPSHQAQDEDKPWWQDWKMGAMAAAFFGVIGLRKTEIGKDIRDLDGKDLLDKLL